LTGNALLEWATSATHQDNAAPVGTTSEKTTPRWTDPEAVRWRGRNLSEEVFR
jgi:hypothetical protein